MLLLAEATKLKKPAEIQADSRADGEGAYREAVNAPYRAEREQQVHAAAGRTRQCSFVHLLHENK
jgi:hypothetical protein